MLEYHSPKVVHVGNKGKTATRVTAVCLCGKEFGVALGDLKRGQKSCGCLRREKHNMMGTRFYRIWVAMKQRCSNQKNIRYKNYGSRGIKVCDDWNKFTNFYKDMFSGYSDNLTIDRINNDKGYCKTNCRWISNIEQQRNRKNNLVYKDECATVASYKLRGNRSLVANRIRQGWSKEKAFTTPVKKLSTVDVFTIKD